MAALPSLSETLSPNPGNAGLRDAESLFELGGPPGYYNAAARAALLRGNGRPPYDELQVDFHERDSRLALRAGGATLAEGVWGWQTSVQGEPLTAAGEWEESCWYRDKECDYLEIELRLSGGWRLERQMLLVRKERFLFLADAVLGPSTDASEIRHVSSLPMASRIEWLPAGETREGWLRGAPDGRRTVIAPALPEWRSEHSHSALTAEGGELSVSQMGLGCNLYVPLWIDLDPVRSRKPLTWRKLTVGEGLETVARDVAVAYRIQAGASQWLFYRSLAPRRNRTFLGENYSSEFACCRFLPTGAGEEIISVEATQ